MNRSIKEALQAPVKNFFHGMNKSLISRRLIVPLLAAFMAASLFFFTFAAAQNKDRGAIPVNLSHLDFLHSQITSENGPRLDIWAIYSEPRNPAHPDGPYIQVTDPDEGISCVDDVARAAIVYMRHYEQFGDRSSLDSAKSALRFVMYMQTQAGLFYNFIFPDGTLNREGLTSIPSLGFWTIRGFWALSEGYHMFRKSDPDYGLMVRSRLLKTMARISPDHPESPLAHYGELQRTGSLNGAQWLINNSTDETALAVISLCTFYETEQDPAVKEMIEKYTEGILTTQGKNPREFPYCSFPSWTPAPNVWHAWGSRQMMALAKAGKLFKRDDWIQAAESEANNLVIHLLASRGLIFGMGPAPILNPQQPYGDEVLVDGLLSLYQATGKKNYAMMAGLMGSWLMGNNSAGKAVYNGKNGRVCDGVDGRKLNLNSGTEATVSGLLALLSLRETPLAQPWLCYREKSSSSFTLVEAESVKSTAPGIRRVTAASSEEGTFSGEGFVEMTGKGEIIIPFTAGAPGEYLVSLVFSMQGTGEGALEVQYDSEAPVEINAPEALLRQHCLPFTISGGKAHRLTLRLKETRPSLTAHIDTLIIQKKIEERILVNNAGNQVTVLKSFDEKEAVVNKDMGGSAVSVQIYDNRGNLRTEKRQSASPLELSLPPCGYCIIFR